MAVFLWSLSKVDPSLHRSAVQAQKYYADVEISENPAADLLGD